jgi:hypothetical protein
MDKVVFEALLVRPEGVGTWTYLSVPFDARKRYGSKGQLKVKGSIDGHPFRSTLLPRGDGTHYLVVPREIRGQIGASAGATVTVVLEHDTAPRTITPPEDMRAALAAREGSLPASERLAPSHQKRYVTWIESAKRQETRQRRIAKAVEMISEGKRLT